jgi:hypothetical protein
MICVPYSPSVTTNFPTISTVGSMYKWVPTNSLRGTGEMLDLHYGPGALFPNAQTVLSELFSVDPLFSDFVDAVLKLRIKDADDPEEDAAATAYSVAQVFYLTPQSRLSLSQAWIAPNLVNDGYGGIRMSWSERGRDVRVSIPASEGSSRKLYWEEGDRYGSVPDVTPTTLTKYLRWMTNGARSVTE